MRRRASPVTEISVSTTEISVTGMKIFPYERFIPVTGMKNKFIHTFLWKKGQYLIITAFFLDFLVQNNSF